MAPRQRSLSSRPEDSFESSESLLSQEQQKKAIAAAAPPTLNQTEADVARDQHDYFNLVALACIVFSTSLNYSFPWLKYVGGHFWEMWATTLLYFFLDLMWVSLVPICVKSPGVIVKHHIVAMMYLIGPIAYPEYRWFMGAILSVEINTWFLICRRLVYRNYYSPSSNDSTNVLLPVVQLVVSAMFYITWISIRCYLYPSYLFMFLRMADDRIRETGVFFHKEMIFITVHTVLCALNIKWTYDLFTPIIKRWLGIGPKQMVVQNGL
ncbi:TLC domain containing protein [Nitzschia inconspicua]|uniref:TLC domain containing protein n=1 Tax=Nitzschia inconspicua TaxID=303405 RepID=A0A9K3KTM2_9STRA|nr:TLC domain containing protein [Nitzschia inconspicua]